jgi:hypothetical protein
MDHEFLKVNVGKNVARTYTSYTIYVPICNIAYITPPTPQTKHYSITLKPDIKENYCTYTAIIPEDILKKLVLNL